MARLTRRLAATLCLVAAAAATVGLAAPAQADPPALLVIEPDHLEGARTVPFHVEDFAPGDSRTASVVVRNDTDTVAWIAYSGATFGDDSMSEYVWVSIRHDGVELAHGRADSVRIHGARFQVDPGTTTDLAIELTMHRGEGNGAQGTSMRVEFEFSVRAGTAPIATGVAPDGTPLSAGGGSQTQLLPPTGESLHTFHLLVWATLGTFGATLLLLLLQALRSRGEAHGEAHDEAHGEARR